MSTIRARVVYLAHTLAVGGAEEMILNLVRHLPDEYQRSVICIDQPGPIGAEIEKTGVAFRSLGLRPGLRRPVDLLRLQQFIHASQATIVHTFLLTASLYGRLAAMLARVPIVVGSEVNIYERKQPLHRMAERWLMRHTDAVVASAGSVRDFYIDQIGADPDKVVVIYNAVDWSQLNATMTRVELRAEIGIPMDAPTAGIIARLTEQKAHKVLLDALVSRSELSSMHVIAVGDGDLRDELRGRAERLGLSRRVHFVGARRDLGNILGAVDMFVMPSLWEGLPLSLVLAMGAGLPVVASRVAGIPEVVQDGLSGLLVDPGSVSQLADAMARLVLDDQLRVRLGRESQAFVRPRFGVDGYIAQTTALYDPVVDGQALRVTLGILYHMPFWQAADGSLWESEGSFARYVDSLAPYFDEIVLSVPVFDRPQAAGSRVRASNVKLAPLPYFPGPRQFYPMLPRVYRRLKAWVKQCDVIHLRVPSPAAIFAFRAAAALGKPVFLLVVGDYEALLPHLPYRGAKKVLFARYVAFEEWALRYMTSRALTFANGAALRAKHEQQGARVIETKTTTLSQEDIGTRPDILSPAKLRALTVSRIDPRKGLRILPAAIAQLVATGIDITIDIVGPTIGLIGDDERDAIREAAATAGVAERVRLLGPVPLDRLMSNYRDYDVFILPTQPGEGIPRVLLEAMANGLPVITTGVSGISSLITDEANGLVVADPSADAIARAVVRISKDEALRRRLIQGGYATARNFTLEKQAAEMMSTVGRELRIPLVVKGAA